MQAVGQIRDATADDVAAILDLHLLADLAEIGEPNTSIDEVQSSITASGMAGGVIDDPEGGLLGHVWVEHQPGRSEVWGDLALRPGADPAIAHVMLDWLVAKAGEIAPGLPLHTFADTKNTLKRGLYEAAGAEIIRRFYRMGISFDETPPPGLPRLAPGVEIRPLADTDADLRAMHLVVDTAFMDHFGHERMPYELWRERTRDGECPDISLWWLATVDGAPAAGLYACRLADGLGYVDTLGTLREFRGRRLGRALILTSFAEFHRRGMRRVVLGVDATNPTGALALYESVGMSAEHEGLRYELR